MNFDKESKSRIFLREGGGGEGGQVAGGGRVMNTRAVRVVILVRTHCQDLFIIAVKYYDNISKDIQIMEQT